MATWLSQELSPANPLRSFDLNGRGLWFEFRGLMVPKNCLLYTSDAADDLLCVDLGGRRIIKKKKQIRITNTIS